MVPLALAAVVALASPIVASEFLYTAAPYPQAHASTIAELADGTLAAAWFGGTREGARDVAIWFARRGARGWGTPVAIARDADHPTWNPVLFQAPGGPLHLYYKVGPNPRDWWGMTTTSDDGGRRWSPPRRLPAGVLGPIKNKPVVLADGSWLSPSSREDGTADENRWYLRMERSIDRGRTWTALAEIASPTGIEAIQPSILVHRGGAVQIVARTRQGTVAMSWSRDGGRSWSPVAATDLPNPNSGTDAVTLSDGRQLIVYNPTGHNPGTPGNGDRYPLAVAVSEDGVRWRRVATLERAPVPDGYAYPAVIQTRDGLVHVTYTHNRTRIRHMVLDPRRL